MKSKNNPNNLLTKSRTNHSPRSTRYPHRGKHRSLNLDTGDANVSSMTPNHPRANQGNATGASAEARSHPSLAEQR